MSINIQYIRQSIHDALSKHMYSTAIIIAEELTRSKKCSMNDIVLFADCYYHNNEYRRCLSILEQSGVLGAEYLSNITEFIHNTIPNTNTNTNNSELCGKINAIHLGAKCLYNLKEYDDCIGLLETVLLSVSYTAISSIHTSIEYKSMITNCKRLNEGKRHELNPISDMFYISGLSYDHLENRKRATNQLLTCLHIDIGCMEAAEYMMNNGLLSSNDKTNIFMVSFTNTNTSNTNTSDTMELSMPNGYEHLPLFGRDRHRMYTNTYYRMLFGGIDDLAKDKDRDVDVVDDEEVMELGKKSNPNTDPGHNPSGSGSGSISLDNTPITTNPLLKQPTSALWLIKNAEYHYETLHNSVEAYRLSRAAYNIDPYNDRGLLLYISSMVDLKMKTEIFYLSHELVQSAPKACITWYSVACYYWVCMKYDISHKYLEKSVRIDKR